MSADLQLFEFQNQPVRFAMIDGEPHPVLSDLCGALDIANVGNVAARIDQAAVRHADISSGGQRRRVTVVTEAGMYEVIFRSDKPEAVEFRRWVTGEVLPAIRKTGSYSAELDLSDPLAAIEAANTRSQQAVEIARAERARAETAEKQVEIEQRHRRAIEGGDGILLSDFGKKYFSEVRHTDFFEHLYRKHWLIDQRGARVRADGEVRNGHDHGKPTYKGRPFIYEHDTGTHGGKRRFQPRVRPQREIELRDALAAEGLPVNTHSTGLVLITNDELKGLGA
jgi:prophage antirepressor-like protein